MHAYACASDCCPGQLPTLPVLQQGCHVIFHCPYQEMQLPVLLCSKAISFSLSPDKNYIAMLLFHCQQPCTKGCLPDMVRAKCGDHVWARAKMGRSSANPDCPCVKLPDFHNWITGKMQKTKAGTSSFKLLPKDRGRRRQSGSAGELTAHCGDLDRAFSCRGGEELSLYH